MCYPQCWLRWILNKSLFLTAVLDSSGVKRREKRQQDKAQEHLPFSREVKTNGSRTQARKHRCENQAQAVALREEGMENLGWEIGGVFCLHPFAVQNKCPKPITFPFGLRDRTFLSFHGVASTSGHPDHFWAQPFKVSYHL